jgi:hypothetical protein
MWQKHKAFWLQKSFVNNVLIGIIFLVVAFFANYYANSYTTAHASNYVTDILLDNLPVVDVHLIFSEGAIVFILALIAILLYEPKYLPFALKSIAVFVLVRSFFLILTHLAPPFHQIYINPADYISRLSSGQDLFFSAHTGLPFLMAFVFWKQKRIRYFFFICSFIGGASVLLGHLHYSIDVFSALFISFGIFHICKNLFPKDYKLI